MADAEVIRIDARVRRPAGPSRPQARMRCRAATSSGNACRNFAVSDDGFCKVHASQARHPSSAEKPLEVAPPSGEGSTPEVDGFVRRRARGTYEIDDFGYDRELSREVLLPLTRPLYEKYFRVRTFGVDRIPNHGPALLVGNHSGTVAIDAVMVNFAVATEHPMERPVRNIGADLVYQLPFISHLARKTGNAVARDEDALELLRRGELVGVYPEGFKGVGKGWRERYKLQRFGRGGFMELALRMRVPIIPVAIVGAEEAFPMIANIKPLANLLRLPYFPVTPTFPLLGPLGMLPLPSRWLIEFGSPIPMDDYPDDAADDAMLVFDLADRVRDTIQQMLYRNLQRRGPAFF